MVLFGLVLEWNILLAITLLCLIAFVWVYLFNSVVCYYDDALIFCLVI